jgi:hypothetical protein
VNIRNAMPDDVDAIAKADVPACEQMEAGSRVPEDAILEAVRRRETRLMAIDACTEMEDGGETMAVNWTCGGFCYEAQDDLYGLLFLRTHPEADLALVIEAVADHLKAKARKSKRRREVRLWLRDDDETLRRLMPLWQRHGFTFRLVPDWFQGPDGGKDGWLGTYVAARVVVENPFNLS